MPGRTPKGQQSHTNEEKLQFVREFGQCVEYGSKTALLRRWGRLGPTAPAKALNMDSQQRARLVALERENERLRAKVASAEAALTIMGKAHELLDGTLKSSLEDDEVPVSLMSVQEYQAWLDRYKTS